MLTPRFKSYDCAKPASTPSAMKTTLVLTSEFWSASGRRPALHKHVLTRELGRRRHVWARRMRVIQHLSNVIWVPAHTRHLNCVSASGNTYTKLTPNQSFRSCFKWDLVDLRKLRLPPRVSRVKDDVHLCSPGHVRSGAREKHGAFGTREGALLWFSFLASRPDKFSSRSVCAGSGGGHASPSVFV